MKNFRELKVWQNAHHLVVNIYSLSKSLPPEEKFGVISQLRRAAVSITANIAEGFGRYTKKVKYIFIEFHVDHSMN